jgi:mono/diheme cytochrome c family protein
MHIFSFLALFYSVLFGFGDFITKQEYAQQLYKNPRGISCQHCHGKSGEGRVIAKYIHKNRERVFIGPKINDVAYSDFYKALTRRRKGMPRYYLTDDEIETLYFYLHQNDKKEDMK